MRWYLAAAVLGTLVVGVVLGVSLNSLSVSAQQMKLPITGEFLVRRPPMSREGLMASFQVVRFEDPQRRVTCYVVLHPFGLSCVR